MIIFPRKKLFHSLFMAYCGRPCDPEAMLRITLDFMKAKNDINVVLAFLLNLGEVQLLYDSFSSRETVAQTAHLFCYGLDASPEYLATIPADVETTRVPHWISQNPPSNFYRSVFVSKVNACHEVLSRIDPVGSGFGPFVYSLKDANGVQCVRDWFSGSSTEYDVDDLFLTCFVETNSHIPKTGSWVPSLPAETWQVSGIHHLLYGSDGYGSYENCILSRTGDCFIGGRDCTEEEAYPQ